MPRGAFVVNRFRVPPPGDAAAVTAEVADAAVAARGLALEEGAGERLVEAHRDARSLAELDARFARVLFDHAGGSVPIVRVPQLPSDVHDLTLLAQLGDTLLAGGV